MGCSGGGSDTTASTTPTTTYKSATITHGGFDFSADLSEPTDYSVNDGESVGWADNQVYATGESYDNGVWFRPAEYDSTQQLIYLYDTGLTDMDAVTSVDTVKWMNYTDAWSSLKVGHVYVFKAVDGYVKFKVTSISSTDWDFVADYKYSSTTSF